MKKSIYVAYLLLLVVVVVVKLLVKPSWWTGGLTGVLGAMTVLVLADIVKSRPRKRRESSNPPA